MSAPEATDLKSDFLRTVVSRGYMHQCTDLEGLDALATEKTVTAYIGFDCTADSLHVGSLVGIMLLRRLQQAGHKPIVLMGGGTTKVGDPSGKDESRQLLSVEDIARNKQSIGKIFEQFLSFGDGPTDAVMVGQCGLAGQPWLYRRAARCGPAFLGQPHADHGPASGSGWSASSR